MELITTVSTGEVVKAQQSTASLRMALKRWIDVGGAMTVLVLLFPLLLLIALSICVHSGGPILYTQRRVGRYGVEFRMWKFRTMHAESSAAPLLVGSDGRIDKRADDRRVTRIGRFL